MDGRLIPPTPPPLAPPPFPQEVPLPAEISLMIDMVNYKEIAARQAVKLANIELEDCGKIKNEIFRKTIEKLDIDTDKFKVTLDANKKIVRIEHNQ